MKTHAPTFVNKSLAEYVSSAEADQAVCTYLASAFSSSTIKSYQSDLRHFELWGGGFPATPASVAKYLATYASTLSYASLARRVAAIHRLHAVNNLPSPVHTELVKATLRGIKRTKSVQQRAVAALQKRDLVQMIQGMEGLRGLRDKALLLVGFAGALRRAELVALNVENLRATPSGLLVHISRSKTDQDGRGRDIAIPYVKGKYCACVALKIWLQAAGITSGPLFIRVSRYGQPIHQRLTAQSVALIVKERTAAVGLDPGIYSGHSLRVGFVTSAAKAGASIQRIRNQTRHCSDAMLSRYVRDNELFAGHPLQKIWMS